MGKNWVDYIIEARRCLWKDGSLLIAETTNALTDGRLSDIRNVLSNQGFEIVKEENIDVFHLSKQRSFHRLRPLYIYKKSYYIQ
jgi:hypothetical protein